MDLFLQCIRKILDCSKLSYFEHISAFSYVYLRCTKYTDINAENVIRSIFSMIRKEVLLYRKRNSRIISFRSKMMKGSFSDLRIVSIGSFKSKPPTHIGTYAHILSIMYEFREKYIRKILYYIRQKQGGELILYNNMRKIFSDSDEEKATVV